MGLRGPPPTATAILKARGSSLVRNRTEEPKGLGPQVPACPARLTREAKKIWADIAPLLAAMRHMTAADSAVLETYCTFKDSWHKADRAKAKFEVGTIERRRVEISAAESNRIMTSAA